MSTSSIYIYIYIHIALHHGWANVYFDQGLTQAKTAPSVKHLFRNRVLRGICYWQSCDFEHVVGFIASQRMLMQKDVEGWQLQIVHPKTKFPEYFLHSGHPRWVHIWRNVALHALFTNGSSSVNGCHQNERPNSWLKTSQQSILVKSKAVFRRSKSIIKIF